MAISTDAAIDFFGTQDTVTSSSSAVADGAFSVAGDITAWTNDDDAPIASIVLTGAYSVAPTNNSSVKLFARLMNIDGTNDAITPDANNLHAYLGKFLLDNTTSTQYIAIDVLLPNAYSSQVYEFYIQNEAGQTLSAGWTLKVTPKTRGPHA